jgi:hypothetical protein
MRNANMTETYSVWYQNKLTRQHQPKQRKSSTTKNNLQKSLIVTPAHRLTVPPNLTKMQSSAIRNSQQHNIFVGNKPKQYTSHDFPNSTQSWYH